MRVLRLLGAFAMLSCANQEPPPPPKHPTIEGDWPSVSQSEILHVIEVVEKESISLYGSRLPPYSVRVTDRNHMEVCFRPPHMIEACHPVERVKGQWKTTERIIVTGQNVPTG